jgi:hypothetical protein
MAEADSGWRRPGRDLCLRRHAFTQVECVLADTHYPEPHLALDGTLWHDGLCGECHGDGVSGGAPCGTCKGVGFAVVDAEDA